MDAQNREIVYLAFRNCLSCF